MSDHHDLIACDLVAGQQKKLRKRKQSLRAMIAQAEKAGKSVASISTPDGITLNFGQPVRATGAGSTADEELEQWRRKKKNTNRT
jgi:hypothetical protein